MFSEKDKLDLKRFYAKFILLFEALIIVYIVTCAWYFGEAVREDNREHFNNVRWTLTFISLPIMLICLGKSILGDAGDMKKKQNYLYALLSHLRTLLDSQENINLIESEYLVKDEEHMDKFLYEQIRSKLTNKDYTTLDPDHLSENIQDLSNLKGNSLEQCEICHITKLRKVHHCSYCGMYFIFLINRCTADMDHHCPWIANCIALNSGKPFLLFCLFLFITTGYWGFTSFRYFIIPRVIKFNW
jgi:hypothetical protein